ncbi:MAG: ParB/RepB/Spo0J family partition protein [Campylobacterota bacterium]
MTGLGRGLGDILSEVDEAYESEITAKSSVDDIYELDIANIIPNPHQPRKSFDQSALKELSASIKQHGILQPIIVKKSDEGFMLLAGERRLKAAKMAGFETIKAIITDIEFDKFRELALIENIQRQDLNAVEIAVALENLIKEHGLTHDELSKRVKKSRTQITNMLRLLSLSDYVKEKVASNSLSFGHAKILLSLDAKKQQLAADTIIGQKLSVRESEQLVKRLKQGQSSGTKDAKKKTPGVDLKGYKNRFSKTLPVSFKLKGDKLELKFADADEIETFLQYFKQL